MTAALAQQDSLVDPIHLEVFHLKPFLQNWHWLRSETVGPCHHCGHVREMSRVLAPTIDSIDAIEP
eukprot:12920481-Prorocentrum_lima.AAC.1